MPSAIIEAVMKATLRLWQWHHRKGEGLSLETCRGQNGACLKQSRALFIIESKLPKLSPLETSWEKDFRLSRTSFRKVGLKIIR